MNDPGAPFDLTYQITPTGLRLDVTKGGSTGQIRGELAGQDCSQWCDLTWAAPAKTILLQRTFTGTLPLTGPFPLSKTARVERVTLHGATGTLHCGNRDITLTAADAIWQRGDHGTLAVEPITVGPDGLHLTIQNEAPPEISAPDRRFPLLLLPIALLLLLFTLAGFLLRRRFRARPAPAASPPVSPPLAGAPLRVFCSYAHEDEPLRDELHKQLRILERNGILDIWHDRRIPPGQSWEKEIDTEITRADLILLLLSPDFISSDYAYGVEMKRALERAQSKEVTLIPVVLRPCLWEQTPLAKLGVLPRDGRAVTLWENKDKVLRDIAEDIQQAALDRKQAPSPP